MPEAIMNFGTVRRFLPAVLRQNSMGWYIEYYAYNPVANGLERKRIRVNRERKRARTYSEFRSIASQMVIQINYQLSAGWSPFIPAAVTMPAAVQQSMPVQQPLQSVYPVQGFQPVQAFQPIQQMQSVQQSVAKVEEKASDSILITDMIARFLKAKSSELTENTMRSYSSSARVSRSGYAPIIQRC